MIERHPLRELNTWGVGGSCAYFVAPDSAADAAQYLDRFTQKGKAVYILGGGSNVLVQDGFLDAAVIHTANLSRFETEEEGDSVRLYLGSGLSVKRLLEYAVRNGLGGLEFLAGIPGTLGGALWGNAGADGTGFSELVERVDTLEATGPKTSLRQDLRWEYRTCPFDSKRTHLITGVVLLLERVTAEEISQRIRHFSELKKGQPLGRKTAGCVFKNPPGTSAGFLIDKSGCKGLRVGDAMVSERHANFIENAGSASAQDIYTLSEMCRDRVFSDSGATLEYEVQFFGNFKKA